MVKEVRYAGADGIRGFACLIVLGVHGAAMFFAQAFTSLVGMGKVGVWLFFVLSAFLLTSKFERSGFGAISVLSYAVSRFIRIIPVFSVVVILYYVFGTAGINSHADLKSALTLRQGFGHLWTIPVEFKFYLFLPLFAFFIVKAKAAWGQAGALVASITLIAVQQGLWPYWLTPENSISTHWYLSSFTIGCYCAVSMDFFRKFNTPRIATVIGVTVVILMILASPIMRNLLLGMPLDRWLMNKFVYLSLLWGAFVIFLADGQGVFGRILKSKFMRKMGAWSFSMYLAHWYFYASLANMYPNSLAWMFFAMLCAVLFGAVLHVMVEAPIERGRHALQDHLTKFSRAQQSNT